MEPTSLKASLADYFAEERTFLAWIRTGLSLMGFGFVVARFALFLQELQSIQHNPALQSRQLSLWFGTALMVLGVAVNVYAAWRHTQFIGQLNRGEINYPLPSKRAAIFALLLALIGLAMAIYLTFLRNSAQAGVIQTRAIQSLAVQARLVPLSTVQTKEPPMPSTATAAANGIVSIPSNHSVDATIEKLKTILQSKGVTIFALVDHSGEAQKVGMTMRPTKLLIFGNPKGGTPVMLAAPTSAIDLPLKLLVWEDAQGKVWLSYNSLPYLQQRHAIPQDLVPNLAVVEALASQATS
jgi:uncharacterized protein (DUF302 family)/uncharacterized membrane protein YidH (DUF202 family)